MQELAPIRQVGLSDLVVIMHNVHRICVLCGTVVTESPHDPCVWVDSNGSMFCDALNVHDGTMAGYMGYQNGHRMSLVFAFRDPAGTMELETLFAMFNIGETGIAALYRQRRLRSMSVGDVVVLRGRAYACQPVGWVEVTRDLTIVENCVEYGSSALPDARELVLAVDCESWVWQ